MRNFIPKIFLVIIITVLVFTIPYGISVYMRASGLYNFIKIPHKGWEGNMHMGDKVLGYKPRPGSTGYETFIEGRKIQMCYDKQGFRVPVNDRNPDYTKRPLFLFLGCSFTYGSACLGEETFAYRTAKAFKGVSINAGAVSYGFAQTLLLAEKLIPEFKPDYVVFQCSPWMAERSSHVYRPTRYTSIPMPYIGEKNGKMEIEPAVYMTNIFDLPIAKYKKTVSGEKDFIDFFRDVALPLYLHDDINRLRAAFDILTGKRVSPSKDLEEIERYAYSRIENICRDNDTQLIYLFLGKKIVPNGFINKVKLQDMITIVDAETELWNQLEDPTRANYDKEYLHWDRSGKKIVDKHPNPKAHKIIANALIKGIVQKTILLKEKRKRIESMKTGRDANDGV